MEEGKAVLSWTAFQKAIVFSLDNDMIWWALPFRTKSAYVITTRTR